MDSSTSLLVLFYVLIVAIIMIIVICKSIKDKTCCMTSGTTTYVRERSYGFKPNYWRGGNTNHHTVHHVHHYVDNSNDIEIGGGYTDYNDDVQTEVGVGSDLASGIPSAVMEMFSSGTNEDSITHDYGGDTNSYSDNNNYEDRNSYEHTESGVGEDLATGFASAVTDMFSSGTNDYGGDSNSYGGGDTNNDDGGGDVIED